MEKDGQIFFALYKDEVIGACAVKKTSPKTYELLKMAVTEKFQSRGVGRLLMNKVIDFAKSKKAKTIELDTSRKLENALKLYEGFGFKISNDVPNPEYERCTIKMTLDLSSLILILITATAFVAYWSLWISKSNYVLPDISMFHLMHWVRQVSIMISVFV